MEHSGRLWKQLVLASDDEPALASTHWLEAFAFAAAAAVPIQVARLAAGFPDEVPTWFARDLSLFVLPSSPPTSRVDGSSTSADGS